MTVLNEIRTALFALDMDKFSVELKDYSGSTFGDYVAELSDGIDRLELVCDRGQVFMKIWDSKNGQFVASTDLFPEMEKVYTSKLNAMGIGEWTLEWDYECDGVDGTNTIEFFSNNTFQISTSTGTWSVTDNEITWIYDSGETVYTGTINSQCDGITGTIETFGGAGLPGCFNAWR